MAHGHVNRLPFTRFENDFAAELRAFASKTTEIHDLPGDDRVYCQTIQKPIQRLEVPVLNATTGFQRFEIDLDLPTAGVVLNNVLHLLQGINGQGCYQ